MANAAGAADEHDGYVRRAVRRMRSSDSEVEAEDLQQISRTSGASTIGSCRCGEIVTLCGPLRSVTLCPASGLPSLEAELYDGSGRVTLVWLGQRHITGIDPGRGIVVKGRLSEIDGRTVMFNPEYSLQPSSVAS